jgi:hypothetical protein
VADYETCVARFDELRAWAAAHPPELFRNEAQTRFDLIDRLLERCLGWPAEQIVVERHHQGAYTDYELGLPTKVAVVEAKRESVGFELPAGFKRPTISLKELRSLAPEIGAAIDQASGYAQERAIPIAAISNGHQLVLYIATRTDGIPPGDGRAVVFHSLDDMADRFSDLWDAVSPPGVAARKLLRQLQADDDFPPPEKLSARLADYPGYKNRNPIAAELQILGGMFFEDILRQAEVESEFLRECYTPSGSLSQYALVSREILAARYSQFSEAEAAATLLSVRSKSGISPELLQDVFAASLSQRPIILLGDVGVGKTIFTRHFIKVEAADLLTRSFVLYIDFGNKPALASDLTSYVRKEFKRQLLQDYEQDIDEAGFVRSVYRTDLQRFASGIYGALREADPEEFARREIEHLAHLMSDEEAHLRRSIEHFTKAQARQAVVFLDNVDQRPFAFQEEVFLIAQSLASDWPVTCFIALRPETFYRSKREGSLTGYQPRVFTIEPPRVDRVIERRLRFSRKELDRTGRLPTFPENLTINAARLGQYVDVLIDAFASNSEMIAFVDNMSGGNVRRALDFVVSFVGSGHVDTMKIFGILDRLREYKLPLHEFMRAVMYGEHEHFDPSDSPIANAFDISTFDGREHFLVPMIIKYVQRAGQSGAEQGFAPTHSIYAFCQSLGFSAKQTASALDRCAQKYLLDTSPRFIQEEVRGSDSERCRVTSVGVYTIDVLLSEFSYLDAMSVDTPIVDDGFRKRVTGGRTIDERMVRAEIFREYLDSQWVPLRDSDSPFDWHQASDAARESMVGVRAGARKADLRRQQGQPAFPKGEQNRKNRRRRR